MNAPSLALDRAGLARAALPVLAVVAFAATVPAILVTAQGTWGYDYQAYAQAALRLLAGERLYDPSVDLAGGFAIYLYPPPFALAFVPFALLGDGLGLIAWTAVLAGSLVLAVALMPVPAGVRWLVLLLAAIDWPVLYAIRLGQVGPILLLLFVLGWRWLERPAALGASIAAGGLIKVQPGLLAGWALLVGRWRAAAVAVGLAAAAAVVTLPLVGLGAWADYAAILARVNSPIATPHNFTPGAVLYQLGVPEGIAWAAQTVAVGLAVGAVVWAALRRTAATSYVVAVVATQLVSPLLWDHYAVVLLLPVAWLLSLGAWWAALIPLATALPVVGITPPAAYPVAFVVALVAPSLVERRSNGT